MPFPRRFPAPGTESTLFHSKVVSELLLEELSKKDVLTGLLWAREQKAPRMVDQISLIESLPVAQIALWMP